MANSHRGEIEVILEGKAYPLCLTLGALAELETAFGSEDLVAVIERFQNGKIKTNDIITILAAGLKGGGADISKEDVATMKIENGIKSYIEIIANLLNATFNTSS